MTKEEITIRLIRQELGFIISHCENCEDGDSNVLETVVDRVIDLTELIDNNTSLPPCYVEPWNDEPEPIICSQCNGSGEGMFDETKCSRCKGWGELTEDGYND